jgi:hypothetical protein
MQLLVLRGKLKNLKLLLLIKVQLLQKLIVAIDQSASKEATS